ncbi:collagen alpha-1(XXVI) chain-like [Manacus vitellinus]|uniref:collagen alpha-1(XXVI) chain-like n=1 Tax=Manacus vitellinus TaxID=328815 RepID=UPI00084711E3|nr:collagen alpha-1(XXVI) chain-like [Manacus vitellinus]
MAERLSILGHWCHYTVTRTVSCQVQNGSETVIQRVYQSCRWPGPCANLVRTLIRPTYKMSYRTVTTLEWRCCPGFTGSNCEEGELSSNASVLMEQQGWIGWVELGFGP